MWNVQIGDVTEIDLECTTYCNLACPECNRTTDKDIISSILNTSHVTLENCRTWFKPTELTKLKEVRFCGAIDEALMNPELTDILDFFLDEFKIKYIDIRTNGSLRSTTWWSNFVNHLPSKHIIVFGLDGLEDTLHIYRIGADYKKVINNAKAFIDAGGIASWQFIEFEHNKHQIEEAKQLAKELGFSWGSDAAFDMLDCNTLASGDVDVINTTLQLILACLDDVKVLASVTEDRIALTPDAPTVGEIVPSLKISLWNGLFVTKGTSQEVKDKLEAVAKRVMLGEKAQALTQETGGAFYWRDAAASAAQIKDNVATMAKINAMLAD